MGGVFRLALTEFHQEMLELTSNALHETPTHERNIVGHTFTFPSKNFSQIKKILDKALMEATKLEADEPSDAVYHVTLSAIPVTQK